jgi:transposase-like protein
MPAKDDIPTGDAVLKEEMESRDPLRVVLRQVVEALMNAEADAVCGAHWGERRRDRVNSRNGYRTRTWDTEVGTIDLAIPKLRHGTYFPGWLLDPQRRAERALIDAIMEAHGKGVSARRLTALLQSLGLDRLSRNQLWKVTREVDSVVRAMQARRSEPGAGAVAAAVAGAGAGAVAGVATGAGAGAAAEKSPSPPDEVWTRDTPRANRS